MNVSINRVYIVFFSIIIFIVLVINILQEVNCNSLIISNIKDGFRSSVVETYNPREWIKKNTAVKLVRDNGIVEGIPLHEEIMNYIAIGDSLIKIKNENICYVKKPNGEMKEFYFIKIPLEYRNHWTFPKEWRNKWMESSAWDTLPARK